MENASETDGAKSKEDNILMEKSIEKTLSSDLKETRSVKTNEYELSPKQLLAGQKQQQQKAKRKHRRGKPRCKDPCKPYKAANRNFHLPNQHYGKFVKRDKSGVANSNGLGGSNRNGARAKFTRSRSLVPYNTNKFLMEEHMAEIPSTLLTPSGRTRDSSFSADSEDNYFISLPEDEEEFLTKEFANVYEKARVERLENLTKQQLIEECLQIEDRYARQQQQNVQRISAEYMSKIKVLEEKITELSRENYNLRCQLLPSGAIGAAAAASPPSATAPSVEACQPTPMDSTSEDSESDSSSTSSSSSSSSEDKDMRQRRRRRSCSSHSSLSEYNAFIENNYMGNGVDATNEEINIDRAQLLQIRMEEDSNQSVEEIIVPSGQDVTQEPQLITDNLIITELQTDPIKEEETPNLVQSCGEITGDLEKK
ncbi:uncharacterized protein LOC119677700 [Teleopsis dalmanni]|uniref:uncharacterized protein LOC119677700 n=1 Tax=Teleopsis dalmanni TaxID=139649 RepID=UPI0018CE0128|nr:uncharacterized protein LOC119677700 [Teleopsis dalmanni]